MAVVDQNALKLALKDLFEGIHSIYIWPMLGWQDIKQRYRRSVLGPFWLTISNAALIGGMGPLYGRLLGQDINTYFAYLAVGFVIWMLIAGIINDSCNAFISAEGYIKEVRLPFTVHVLRVVWKNVLILAHNFVIVIVMVIIYARGIDWHLLLAPFGVCLIAVNGIWLGLLFGLLCARFRDIPQLVSSLLQIVFFLTPIMWRGEMLGRHQWVVQVNPIYHFLEITRAPLLAGAFPTTSWIVVGGITFAGFILTLLIFARYRARIAYWV
ncbi:MAG: ABC transporter permease [Gammaproteobacteria bacterium]